METQYRWLKSVSRGEHVFVGFDERYRQAPENFSARIKSGTPEMWSVKNATIMPLTGIAGSARFDRSRRGGVSDETGYLPRLGLNRYHGDDRKTLIAGPADAPASGDMIRLERAWFGGYLFGAYGHFLLESIARLLSPEAAASNDPIVFLAGEPGAKLYASTRQVFDYLGIDPERIVLVTSPIAVSELFGQDPAYEMKAVAYPELYRRVQAAHKPVKGKAIFLSRSALPKGPNKRWADREVELQERLADTFGIEIIHPEQLSFAEQIAKFAECETVIGLEGAAFFNGIFLRETPHFIKLCGGRPPLDLVFADELCDGRSTYVFVGREPLHRANRKAAPWPLDVERAVATVGALLGQPSP